MTDKQGQIEGLTEAWFTLSEEMGRQWSQMTGSKAKDAKDIFGTWMEYSNEMGRTLIELNRGEPGAYASTRKAWSEWNERMTEQLSKAGSDMPGMKDMQDAWARNATRINKLLAEQSTGQLSAQMDKYAKATEKQAAAFKPMSSKDVQDVADLTTTMAKYWADNYTNVVGSIQGIIEGEGDASGKSKRIYDAWSGFTSDMMKEVMRTAAFSKWMGNLRDTDLDYMLQTRRLNEEALRSMGSPTRSDMEEVQKSLKELTMELRSLKQSLNVGSPKAKGDSKAKGAVRARGAGRPKGKAQKR